MRVPAWLSLFLLAFVVGGCGTFSTSVREGELEVHTFAHGYNNAHLVVGHGGMVLVDSGLPDDADDLDRQIRDAGIDPAKIRAVVLTHGHADHAGGAKHFKDKYGVRIVAGAGDAPMMRRGANDPLCPHGCIAEARFDIDQEGHYTPTVADVWIDGPTDLAPLAGIAGSIMPVPAHTPGSLVVIAGEVAIVGDLFRGGIVGGGAAEHFYNCDPAGNHRLVRALLETTAPRAKRFFVGHFGPVDRSEVLELYTADGGASP